MPESVQALIAARLDTLAPERKALVHDAAVVGNVFWSGALSSMSGVDVARHLPNPRPLLVFQTGTSSRFQEGRRWAALAAAALRRSGGSPEYEGELSSNVATLARGEGKLEEARDAYERAAKLLQHELGPDHPAPLIARANLAAIHLDLNQPDRAVPLLEEAIAGMSRLRGPAHPTLMGPLTSLTRAQLQLGAPERAFSGWRSWQAATPWREGRASRFPGACWPWSSISRWGSS